MGKALNEVLDRLESAISRNGALEQRNSVLENELAAAKQANLILRDNLERTKRALDLALERERLLAAASPPAEAPETPAAAPLPVDADGNDIPF